MGLNHMYMAIVISAVVMNGVTSIILDEEATELLKTLLKEFEDNPDDMKFTSVIQFQGERGLKIPKVLIWCPIRHFKLEHILCPVHNQPLKIGDWVDVREPLLVYDIASNILLIQCLYTCDKDLPDPKEKGHTYLSASQDIVSTLPGVVLNMFPVKIHYSVPLSTHLLDFIIVELDQGHSFEDVCLSLSSLNMREFMQHCQLEQQHGSNMAVMNFLERYRDSALYAQPTEENLVQVFLAYMNDISLLLQEEMNKRVGRILTCDNTFKLTSKDQDTSEAEKANSQCEGIFLGTNENKEIVFWRMVDLLSFNEMQEVLVEYAERLRKYGETLQMAIVDDCCQVRTMYDEIFGSEVKVKLNLLQASQHVISKLPKGAANSQQIMSDFKQVFRATGDAGEERFQTTPSIEEMSANLEIFLGRWRSFLTTETLEAVQIVQGHIVNGCLSGIPAGCGTENNENLQDYLKKHIISNVTNASPELTVAVLAFALYAWNCHKKHSKLLKSTIFSKIQPAIPVELLNMVAPTPLVMKCSGIKMSIVDLLQDAMDTDSNNELRSYKTDSTVRYMVMRILDLNEFLVQMRKKCKDQGENILKYLFLNKCFAPLSSTSMGTEGDILGLKNKATLKKNLTSCGLKVDKVIGDGNCCFRSIVTQVRKITSKAENSAYADFVKSLGLNSSIDDDVQCLRALFVQEISSKVEKYKRWISLSEEKLNEELRKFTEDGFYEGDLGDFCVKVCSDILQIPIVVVTSYDNAPQVPFVPENVTLCEPVILAFDHTAPGHYDGTADVHLNQPLAEIEQGKRKKCSCGRRSKDTEGGHCKPDLDGRTSKCICVKSGKTCSKYCSCFRCCNDKRTILTDEDIIVTRITNGKRKKPCRCGKKGVPGACKDSEIRRCKCPCFRAGLGCNMDCACKECANIFNDESRDASKVLEEEPEKKKIRKRKHEHTIKQDENGEDDADGLISKEEVCHWTDLEVLAILVAQEILEFVRLPLTSSNVHELYSFLLSSLLVNEMHLQFSEKTVDQVEAKMKDLKETTQNVFTETVQETLEEKSNEQVIVSLPDLEEAQIILLLSAAPEDVATTSQESTCAEGTAEQLGTAIQQSLNGDSAKQVLEEGRFILVSESPVLTDVNNDSNMTELEQTCDNLAVSESAMTGKTEVLVESNAMEAIEETNKLIPMAVTSLSE